VIVILEGPDGAGKTTLARELCASYDLEYHHEGPPPLDVDPLLFYGKLLQDARTAGRRVVFDRMALGERVYGPIYRKKDRLGELGWRVFVRLIRAAGARQILCLPSYEVCRASWASGREELLKTEDAFARSYHAYVSLAARGIGGFRYDYTKPMQRTDLGVFLFDGFHGFDPTRTLRVDMVGCPGAKYLLVGDQRPRDHVDLPFFEARGSSAYLTAALDEAWLAEEDVAFVNAYPRNSATPVEIPFRQFRRVVALGERASAVCRAQDACYKTIPHPQYWKRFHHHSLGEYARRLRDALDLGVTS
jgi:hypothetical protein